MLNANQISFYIIDFILIVSFATTVPITLELLYLVVIKIFFLILNMKGSLEKNKTVQMFTLL